MESNHQTKALIEARKQKFRFWFSFLTLLILSVIFFIISISVGRAGITSPLMLINTLSGDENYSQMLQILNKIRIPRACASFLVGSSLAVSGLVYQNTFNNKLVSPGILGVSSGCCVGAGLAILLGLSAGMIKTMAFLFGITSVLIAVFLPLLFKNRSALILVLSGIIVGSFMDSVIALIKYVADKNDKLSEITFWMMGSLVGIQYEDIMDSIFIYLIPVIILVFMRWRINVLSLGLEEAESLGINYKLNRLIVIICATVLTANCVSISGNIGWIGLVIPHIARAFAGDDTRSSLPVSAVCGGLFLLIVDTLSRLLSVNEIPLSIITGLIGAVIYALVLVRKGRYVND